MSRQPRKPPPGRLLGEASSVLWGDISLYTNGEGTIQWPGTQFSRMMAAFPLSACLLPCPWHFILRSCRFWNSAHHTLPSLLYWSIVRAYRSGLMSSLSWEIVAWSIRDICVRHRKLPQNRPLMIQCRTLNRSSKKNTQMSFAV